MLLVKRNPAYDNRWGGVDHGIEWVWHGSSSDDAFGRVKIDNVKLEIIIFEEEGDPNKLNAWRSACFWVTKAKALCNIGGEKSVPTGLKIPK